MSEAGGERLPLAKPDDASRPPDGPTTMTWRRLMWFDATGGTWVALATLRRELGWWRLLRLLLAFSWRSVVHDPFRGLPRRRRSKRERLSRHQMKPVLLLDDCLRGSLGLTPEASLDVLRAVVRASGKRFLARTLTLPDRDAWRAKPADEQRGFVRRQLAAFFNMRAEVVDDPSAELAFDVSACWFAELGRALDRADLVPLFCAADSAYFDDPTVPVGFRRAETLAGGESRCTFRLSFKEDADARAG